MTFHALERDPFADAEHSTTVHYLLHRSREVIITCNIKVEGVERHGSPSVSNSEGNTCECVSRSDIMEHDIELK